MNGTDIFFHSEQITQTKGKESCRSVRHQKAAGNTSTFSPIFCPARSFVCSTSPGQHLQKHVHFFLRVANPEADPDHARRPAAGKNACLPFAGLSVSCLSSVSFILSFLCFSVNPCFNPFMAVLPGCPVSIRLTLMEEPDNTRRGP